MNDLTEVFDRVPPLIALAAVIGFFLLLPLYLSQRRDVLRLREFMERAPDHPREDIAASEALLDRTEAELEELLGEQGADETLVQPTPGGAPAAGTTPPSGSSAAARVTSERPALERITMERSALAPHPHWRRFLARVSQPRVLVAIAILAILLGLGGIYASEQLLSGDGGNGERAGGIDRSEVTVAVLNGTATGGLAGKVGADVQSAGYQLGAVTNTSPGHEETEVLYAEGQQRAARTVARDLGVGRRAVAPLERDTRTLAIDPETGEAPDVVVIAGEDRASR